MIEEVVAQNLERLLRLVVAEERPEAGDHVLDARAEVADEVVEVVGVLVLAAADERERLEHDEGPGAADPDLARRLLAEDASCRRSGRAGGPGTRASGPAR